MNPKVIQRVLNFLFFSIVSVALWSQENQGLVSATIVQNTSFTQFVESNPTVQIYSLPDVSHGNVFISPVSGGADVEFDADPNFTGETSFVVKYFSGVAGQSAPKFITYKISVRESIVTAADDYVDFISGSSDISINVLSNDSTTAGSIETVKIVNVAGGTASVNGNNSILFTPTETSNFTAFVEYVATDDLGGYDLGSVTIQSDDVGAMDTMRFTVTNDKVFNIVLPDDNCTVSANTSYGDMDIDGLSLSYTPDEFSNGEDEGEVIDANNNATVIVFNVLNKENQTDFVKDDFIYTATNEDVDFDAFENDFEVEDGTIVDHSSELVHNGEGDFSYTPPAWYHGTKKFFYTVYNGIEHQTADIYVTVGNQVPKSMVDYTLSVLENEGKVLDYSVPLEDYEFQILAAPSHGTLSILNGTDIVNIECNEITGAGKIVYQPNLDYIGADDFDLEYFVNGASASIVKVTVDVLEDDQSELCHCVGADCVWPGDANHDGRVYVDDLLPIGLYMGSVGTDRSDIGYNFWNGQSSTDWDLSQGEGGANMKYVDSDGDGYVTADDADMVADNYSGIHNLFAKNTLGTKSFGLSLEWLNTADTVYAGETLCLGINIGTEEFPVVDMHGLSVDLNLNPLVIDSSSTVVDFHENGWFTYNSSQLDMMVQPYDGRIDMGVTRADGTPTSGFGIIAETCFIVEEDVGGIRSGTQEPITEVIVQTTEISVMDADGNYWSLPNQSIEIPLRKKRRNLPSDTTSELILYPNPTAGQLNVHLNSGVVMNELFILDMNGRTLKTHINVDSDHHVINVSDLTTGIYLAKAKTDNGWINKRFKVINE